LLQYERVLAPLDGFVAAVNAFRTSGGRGLNVTAPFKQQAFEYATERTARAEASGAVNTLAFADHAVLGDNTDGAGLLRDIERLGVALAGARVLVLGAGGAARGSLAALLDAGCAEVAVANRTAARAFELAKEPALQGVLVLPIDALVVECFDIIINASSGGLQGASMPLPDGLLARARLAYDMIYGARPTAFLLQAQAAGCPLTANGLGMLVEQAAESFRLWRGVLPDTAPVLTALLQTLAVSAGDSGS
jgi:shikimate dehydrogenase